MTRDYETLIKPAWEPVEAGEMEPGTPVKIHEADRGSKDQMHKEAASVRRGTLNYVLRYLPLECWWVTVRPPPADSWGGYEVWAEFHGVMDRVQDRGRWQARQRRERRAARTNQE